MATLNVRLDLYVFKLKAYKVLLKVRKFQLPTYYRFSTAEGKYNCGWIPPPPGLIGLNREIQLQDLQQRTLQPLLIFDTIYFKCSDYHTYSRD